MKFALETMGGYEILSWEENPGVRLKVKFDKERFFIASIAKYGEYKQSKVKPKIKFDIGFSVPRESQSIPPQDMGGNRSSLLQAICPSSQESQSEAANASLDYEEEEELAIIVFENIQVMQEDVAENIPLLLLAEEESEVDLM